MTSTLSGSAAAIDDVPPLERIDSTPAAGDVAAPAPSPTTFSSQATPASNGLSAQPATGKLSFGLGGSRSTRPLSSSKLASDAQRDDSKADTNRRVVSSLSASALNELHLNNDSQVQQQRKAERNKTLVIPLPAPKHAADGERSTLSFESVAEINARAYSSQNGHAEQPAQSIHAATTQDSAGAHDLQAVTKQSTSTDQLPLLLRNRRLTADSSEEGVFRRDVASLPSEAATDYDAVPIDSFGAALLRGMGWNEGQGIGLTNKTITEPKVYERRGDRRGLGATQGKPNSRNGQSQTSQQKPPAATSLGSSNANAIRKLQQSGRIIRVHQLELNVQSLIEITAGKHMSRYGRVLQLAPAGSKLIRVQLNNCNEVVQVGADQLTVLDERALPLDHPAIHQKVDEAPLQTIADRQQSEQTVLAPNGTHKRSKSSPTAAERQSDAKRHKSSPPAAAAATNKPLKWAKTEGLVVRIVSKSLLDGRLYGQKAVIEHIPAPSTLQLRLLSNNDFIDNITERHIETVLPKDGGTVRVVHGKYRDQLGTVMERDNKRQIAHVQLMDDLSVHRLPYDDVTQYFSPEH